MRKKHVRRCAKELKKEFPCLYNCGKSYATDAARNMHMRILAFKKNGKTHISDIRSKIVSKTERRRHI